MPLDLYLTNNGDLSFYIKDSKLRSDTLEYNFHVATSASLLLNFYMETFEENSKKTNPFVYEFYVYTPENNKTSSTIDGNNYIQQAIKIRIQSEIGTIRGNETLGTDIHTLIHSNMSNSRLAVTLGAKVKNAISDILPNATVNIYFLNTDYLNYHESIRIVIINNENTYYYTL